MDPRSRSLSVGALCCSMWFEGAIDNAFNQIKIIRITLTPQISLSLNLLYASYDSKFYVV